MSLVSSLSIAQQALSVNQSAITVISNNIANVDNKSYSKQSVELADVINYSHLTSSTQQQANSLSGVQISKISRLSDENLETYYRNQNSSLSYLTEYSTISTAVQTTMNELNNTGLNDALSKFYTAANALANDPTDVTARQNYVSCASNVCSIFNNVYNSLNTQQQNLVGDYTINGSVESSDLGTDVTEVNNLLDQLSSINSNIVKTNSTNTSSAALLDQRDSVLEKLSGYMPVTTSIRDNGTADVTLGGLELVKGPSVTGYLQVKTGPSATNPATINIVDSKESTANVIHGNVNAEITSGQIGAILDVTGAASSSKFTINGVISDVNALAKSFADELNAIQAGSSTTGGTTTYAMCLTSDYKTLTASASTNTLFVNKTTGVADTNINAGNISVNATIQKNLYLVAAGRSTSNANSSNIGNNTNMTSIAATKTTTYAAIGNQTFTNYLATTVSGIGSNVESINNNLETQTNVVNSITSQLSSKTGVNLDEELGELIKFQQAYQAAAKVFSTCNQLLEELLQLGK